ncbi:hypothetical protein ACL2XP_22715 [Sodalis sp. RH21]|uniref:hypothetical protein n=1 Tax=unclassified Sodalis (in: enterobacteria) TaxID=2636512 RepID=UPI0039B4C2C8
MTARYANIDRLDWVGISAQLDIEGYAVLPGLLHPDTARELARLTETMSAAHRVPLASAAISGGSGRFPPVQSESRPGSGAIPFEPAWYCPWWLHEAPRLFSERGCGYRPCAVCMPKEYAAWQKNQPVKIPGITCG